MPVTTYYHLVICKVLAHRYVVHDHQLSPGDASLLENSLKKHFSYLDNVRVDHEAPQEFTVKFDPSAAFKGMSEYEQRELYRELIEHTLRFIGRSPRSTRMEFNDF